MAETDVIEVLIRGGRVVVGSGTVYFMMTEDNLKLQLQQPWMKISTDAGGLDPAWAEQHGPTHPDPTAPTRRFLADMCESSMSSHWKMPCAR